MLGDAGMQFASFLVTIVNLGIELAIRRIFHQY
jgi:hypothetical protein